MDAFQPLREPLLAAENLGKSFAGVPVLAGITFEVVAGETAVIQGAGGAGKTTLCELILGWQRPSEGSVRVFGHDSLSMPEEARARIGVAQQHDEWLGASSAAQNLAARAALHGRLDSSLAYGLSALWRIPMERRVMDLSERERQKLSAVLASAHRPDLLLLDEPFAAYDGEDRLLLLQELIGAVGDRCAVLVMSSCSQVRRLATRSWVLAQGSLGQSEGWTGRNVASAHRFASKVNA